MHMRNKRWIKENLTLQNLKFLASKPDPITMFSFCYKHLFSTMVLGSGAGLGYSKLIANQIKHDSNVENYKKISENIAKRLKIGFLNYRNMH